MYRITATLLVSGAIVANLYHIDALVASITLYNGRETAADDIVEWAAEQQCHRFELTIVDEKGHELTDTACRPTFNRAHWRTGCWTRDGYTYNTSTEIFDV